MRKGLCRVDLDRLVFVRVLLVNVVMSRLMGCPSDQATLNCQLAASWQPRTDPRDGRYRIIQ